MLSPVATKKFAELYETDGQKNVLDKETDQLLVPILKEIKYGIRENIMDHGCGTGRVGMKYFVPAAERTDSKIYAIDRSESMISHAKEYYSHPRVTYYRTHLLSPEFPLNAVRFNKIFSIHVLIADPEWRATLKKMYELLKPRGILTAMLVVQSTDYFAAQKHLVEHHKWNKHSLASGIHIPDWIKDGSDPEDLFRQELTSLGFNILSIDTNARTHTFPTKAECIELYMAAYPPAYEENLETPEHRHEFHEIMHSFLHKQESDRGHRRHGGSQEHTVLYETLVFSAQKPESAATPAGNSHGTGSRDANKNDNPNKERGSNGNVQASGN